MIIEFSILLIAVRIVPFYNTIYKNRFHPFLTNVLESCSYLERP